MFKDVNSFKNYIKENFEKGTTLSEEHIDFINDKLKNIRAEFNRLDKLISEVQIKTKNSIANMQVKVVEAESRERLNIKKQEVFGSSQTKVEEARHKNIMQELEFMKNNKIVVFNRSSYPFYPRFMKKKQKV